MRFALVLPVVLSSLLALSASAHAGEVTCDNYCQFGEPVTFEHVLIPATKDEPSAIDTDESQALFLISAYAGPMVIERPTMKGSPSENILAVVRKYSPNEMPNLVLSGYLGNLGLLPDVTVGER